MLPAVGLQGQFLFQLFKAFPLSFGAAVVKEDEGGEADGGIDPETAAAAEGCIHGREEEGEGAAAYPEGKGAGSHRYATDAVGEDFCKQGPGDRAECHGIAGNGCHDEGYHQDACLPCVVAGAEGEVDEPQSAGSEEHQGASSPPLNGVEGNEGEEHVGYACDDDVDKHSIDVVAGAGEDFFCIVEDDVGAAPLLENGYDKTEQEHAGITGGEEVAQRSL